MRFIMEWMIVLGSGEDLMTTLFFGIFKNKIMTDTDCWLSKAEVEIQKRVDNNTMNMVSVNLNFEYLDIMIM